MLKKLLLTLLCVAWIAPAGARAATITAVPLTVGLGTTVVDLVLDPQGVTTAAWLVVLSGTGLSIDSIANVVPVGTDCFGFNSAASFDGQCAGMPLNGTALVAPVTITASAIGGTLSLVSGNITDDRTFLDIAITPGVLPTVVPEPATLALMTMGAFALVLNRRRQGS